MTAVMASLFVPMVGNAAEEIPPTVIYNKTIDENSFKGGNANIIATGCSGSGACTGHTIKVNGAVTGGTQGVVVRSGHHYIKLEGADIETSTSVLEVQRGATVTLVLEGESELKGGAAGIYVAQGATLNIMEDSSAPGGTLKVRSTGEGAGIGGYGIGDAATAGTINIESGTIIAQGGNRGAGIGGSGSGTVESIKINDGIVVAKGGDGEKGEDSLGDKSTKPTGAPGIGHGNVGARGNIVINGGSVTAIGGDHLTTGHAMGISGANVTSAGGGNTVIVSDGISPQTNNVNALVWDLARDPNSGKLQVKDPSGTGTIDVTADDFLDKVINNNKEVLVPHGKVCTVYGTVEMPVTFPADFNKDSTKDNWNTLYIPSGASFKIPEDAVNLPDGFNFYGILWTEENSMIVNPNQLHFKEGDYAVDKNTRYKMAFNPTEDIIMKGPFTYKGEAYQSATLPDNEVFKVRSTRSALIGSDMIDCPVDIEGLKYEFRWGDQLGTKPDIKTEGVKHAGEYVVKFIYGTTEYEEKFTIEQLPITDSGVTVDRIPDKEFKNAYFADTDFSPQEVIVRYKDVQLEAADYSWHTQGQKDVTDAATLTIQGGRNFSGTRDVSFRITARAMTDENTKITLKTGNTWKEDGDGNYTTVYDGNQHIPDSAIEKASVQINETESLDVDGINFDMKCSAETEESKYVDAGTITVTITPKTKNFTGECKKTFIIKPKPIVVTSVTPVETRAYNGAANIRINEIEADITDSANGANAGNIIWGRDGTADRPIELPTGVEGIIAEGGKVVDIAVVKDNDQEYTEVYIDDDVTLAGKGGRNYTIGGKFYTINGDGNGNQLLKNGIKITAREAPVIASINGEAIPDEAEPPKFNCNLVITTKEGDVIDPTSIIYCYRCEADEEPPEDLNLWDAKTLDTLTYEKLAPNHDERFYIRIGGTRNVAAMETPVPCTVSIPKYPRKEGPPAEQCTLTASETPNENGETYKLTVTPEQEFSATLYPEGRYLYSLSEEGPYTNQPSTLLDNADPNTEYIAYIKYAATDEYTESETGSPTNAVTTGEGIVQKPTVTCNGTTQSEGEIHFSGTASVSLEYTGAIGGTEIRYTVDGTQPTASSTLYEGAFDVNGSVTVNAFVIKPGVANSAVTSVKLVRDGDSPSNPSTGTEVELQRLTEETAPALLGATALPTKGIDTFDAVSTPLATPILQQRGYENNNITYADLKIKIKGTDRYATEDDFKNAAGGVIRVTITMDQLKAIGLPAGYDGTTHNFAVTHMFATAGANLGNVETIGTAHNFSKSRDGKSISFDMTSTSPVAFGWADVNNSDPNPVGPGTDDPGNQDPGTDDPGNQDPGTQDPGTQDPNTIVGEGDPRQGAQGTQGNGTTTGTDAGTQGASNDAANALSGIMPKTGDPLSFVPWIAAIVISVGAIAFFATRKKDKKKQTVKKTQAAKKKK